MAQSIRTRYLTAAFMVSLGGLGLTAGAQKLAQTIPPNGVVVIDNDMSKRDVPGFTQQGWVLTPVNAHPKGYNGDTAYLNSAAQPRASLAKAQWTFSALEGRYAFYATWGELKEGDPKAPYVLSTKGVTVYGDQTKPAPVQLDGRGWLELGTADLKKADVTTVTLTSGGKGFTLADAVMARKIDTPTTPPPPPPSVMCGNGVVETGEECDDGNQRPGDGCHRCRKESCGDGVVTQSLGEQCDYGEQNGTQLPGSLPAEACAKENCTWLYCGDKIVTNWIGEQCDGGADCARDCKLVPNVACNDGVDNDGDGNIDMNDKGCSATNDKDESDGAADLAMHLTANTAMNSGQMNPGETLVVSLTMSNDGPDLATTPVEVVIQIPKGMTYVPSTVWKYCSMRDDVVVCSAPLKLEAFGFNISFKADENIACGTPLKFEGQIKSALQSDPNSSNNSASATINVKCPQAATCTDTDNGKNPNVKGTVNASANGQSYVNPDVCNVPAENNEVVEYFCDGNTLSRELVKCAYGCADGACKPKPVVSVCSGPVATGAVDQNQKITTDVNDDGVTDARDLNEIITYYRNRTPVAGRFYNVDGLGSFDVQDILLVINYNRCVQQNPPTTIEPGATITMKSAALSCVADSSQFSVSYTKTGITNGFLHLLSADGIQLTETQFNADASSTSMNPPPTGIVPGALVKMCVSSNHSLCSPPFAVTGTACAAKDTVTLTSVVLSKQGTDDVANVTYEKNFDTCVHMLNAAGAIQHRQNHFCAKSGTITVKLSAGLTVKEGDSVKLCHGNNYGLCSAVVKVTKEATVTDSVSLSSVVMTCRDGADYANVSYKKNFATCAHLKNAAGVNFGTQNFFCDNETSKLVKASDLPGLALGTQVKLCHGNNAGVCSQLVTVTGTTCTATIAPVLNVAVKSIGSTDVAVKNSKNVNLLRFEALAANGTYISQSQDVLLTKAVFRAAAGSLLNGQNYTLWFDSNKDNVVDTILQKGAIVQNNLVTFDNLAGGGAYLTKEEPVLFEVHADIASSLTNNALQLEFATSTANYLEAENPSDGAPLTGIKTNGACGGAKCDVIVTTVPSKAFTLVNQGDLFVTLDSTPSRSRQLLGGTLGDTILRMQFRAQHEDIDVTDLQITSRGSDASSIDRLELYKDGATTAFATATVSGCDSDDVIRTDGGIAVSVFCANMENAQLIVPDGQNLDVLVRPRMKSDEQGALSGQDIRLFVSQTAVSDNATGRGAVRARGRESSSNLMANDNDATNEGEVFIGTDNGATNMEITGNRNTVSLSKITSITNANPDADNANVPTGVSPVGQFRFTAASNANTLNGLNKVSLRKLTFTVSTTNVPLDTSAFKFYNKADSSSKTACTVASGGGVGGLGGGNINMTYEVECASIANTAIDGELESGESSTFVLEAKILNPNTSTTSSSSLQVSLKNFALAFQPTSGIEWQDKDAGSVGNGTTTSSLFNWFEYSDTVVRSTLYKS